MNSRQLLVCGMLICTGAVLLLAASCQSLVDTIPPQSATETALIFTFDRIQTFWNEHGRVPTTAAELPDVKDHDCSMQDGWGRELHWDSDGKSKVRVWSLGRDGKPGGTGQDADMEVVFDGKQMMQEGFPRIRRSDVPQ